MDPEIVARVHVTACPVQDADLTPFDIEIRSLLRRFVAASGGKWVVRIDQENGADESALALRPFVSMVCLFISNAAHVI